MGSLSDTLPRIPVIDFSGEDLKPQTDPWLRTTKLVKLALEEFGCFVAVYDKVSPDLQDTIFHELEGLFNLPNDVKARNIISDKPYFGYSGNHPLVPLLEGTGIDNATSLEGIQSFASLMWPAGNDRFSDTALSYVKQVSELERAVTRMLFDSYGLQENYYDSHVGSTNYMLRLMKYRAPDPEETDIGCDVHTDKSFFTILHQNEVNGLEIKTKGGDWVGFELSPSSFVVMAGDALMAWSNGRVHSAFHRVVMNRDIGNKSPRYSVGLFTFHSGMIHIPQELVDDEHPLQFKSFEHYGLLRYFATLPQLHERTAKAYCGI
ncbi:probable 2-oxoglutarate-dependent dioxygenase AOP1 [Punica granatum]|uniref:Fe2OG dioxygenase domain-containing protein n=2 Tax=Punica granatum TaxID=22663 RepID=A0A218XC54_PUNGR|nr:probable 2-oxoglutarate-dependent dioxygenase AOP1 [Punica granatum]OWM82296.1 hypothetical protein CDL15_Pgr001870 [Punica granatum]PKI62058.1 hypothetical protein CRG98_017431 [Punica granatum]